MSQFIEALTWEPDDVPYVYLDTGQRIGGPSRDTNVEESGSLTPSTTTTTTTTNAGARHLALAFNANNDTPGPSQYST